MFLESVSSLGLLSPDDKSNILGAFSLSVKRTVAQQIVGFLLEVPVISGKSTITNVLPTEEHIKWAMEAIGQSFALPIYPEDESIIASAIELYRRWLLEPDHRPKVLKDDSKQFFFQTILKHCSLLFQVRKLDRETCDKHARLCSKVLTLYLAVAREQQKTITTESWEVWLKLLVGIAEGMFRAQPGEELLGQLLATQTLKTLFEIWLLSHTRNAALWQTLKDLMKNWTHLMASVVQWNATTADLTNRVVALLYGPSEGPTTTPAASKMDRDDAHPLDLQGDFVFFAWHRILHIIGNPNTLNDPKIFLEAIRGIHSLINIYLSIGRSNKKCTPPSGNTILHIFGAWLFEAIKLGRQGFDEGTALAVEAICNIFHSRKTTKYETLYYASYYSCLSDVLLREGRILVSCLLSCKHFFLYELEGSRVLIPYFIYAISNILSKPKSTYEHVVPYEQVREACLCILDSIICLPNYFGQTKFSQKLPKEIQMKQESTLQTDSKETAKSKPLPEITTYSALKAHLTLLLLKGLKTETNPQNTEMLLWLLLTHLYETIDDNSDFAHLMIDTILSKIKSMALWPYKVTLTAFKVLSTMTQFYSKIPNNNEEASSVVSTLAKFIVAITTESQSDDNDKLIIGAYQCMLDWLISDQWIVKDSQCVSQVLNSIVLGLGITKAPPKLLPLEEDKKKKDREPSVAIVQSWSPSDDIKAMARYVLLNILNNLGNFPPASGARRVSSIVAEEELLDSIKAKLNSNSDEFLRYFIFDDSVIFGVVDLPYEEGGPSLAVIIRDQTGKYAWQAQLVYVPTTVKDVPSKPTLQNVKNTVPYQPKPLTKPVSDFKDLFAYLEQQRRNENIIELTQKQVSIEDSYLKAKNYGLDIDIMVKPPTSTVSQMYSGDSKLQMSRILLSHLGFLSPENRSRVRRLEKKESLLQSLKNLDQIPERYTQSIGVVFVGEGNKTESEIYGNQNGTGDYQEFLTGLGWGVQTSTHLGHLGGVDPSPSLVLPYFADYCTEVIFHVSTLLPNADSRKKLISKDYVVIVWAEDDVDNYNYDNSQFKNNDVQIVIHPQSSGLYRVRVISKTKERGFSFGPLLDNMAVRKESLPALVRATAMNAYKHIQQQKEANYRPFVTRRATIEEISNRFKREEPIEHFYSSLFTNTTAGQSTTQVAPVTAVVPTRTASAPARSVSAVNINRPTSPPPQQPGPTPTKPTATKAPSGSVALPKTPTGATSPAAPGSPAPLAHSSSSENMSNWNSTSTKTPVTRNASGFLSRNKLSNSQETSTQKP